MFDDSGFQITVKGLHLEIPANAWKVNLELGCIKNIP